MTIEQMRNKLMEYCYEFEYCEAGGEREKRGDYRGDMRERGGSLHIRQRIETKHGC